MNEDVECLEPLNCHMCGFECFSRNELKTHMGIHSGLKPFMCMICNEKFSQKSNLERHCSFYHGGCGHGQTSLNESNYGQSDETGVLTTGEISGMNKEDVHSNTQVTDSKRGRRRKTENNNVDPNLDNSTEDVICLSDEVTTANINNMKLVQYDRKGEKSGINKEEKHSDTTRRKRGRTGKIENKTIHSKLDNSSEEVICLSNDGTTANVKGGQTNSLQCYICFEQFVWFDDLQVHLNIHTKEKPYMCPVCKGRFCNWDALKTHFLTHISRDKKIREDEKSEELQSDTNLEEKTAGISESVLVSLKLSEKSTDGVVESSVCNYCKTGFVDPKFLESHSKGHLSEKPWTCNHCQESFHEESSLKLHHRYSHAGEKHWICDMCKKRYKFTGALNHHLLIHAGKKPFNCKICGKGFTERRNLKLHTMMHSGGERFKCNICNDGFSAKHHLEGHKNAMSHNGETRFKCNICSKEFIHERRFQFHMKSHIGEKLRKLKAASVDEPSTSTTQATPKPMELEENCETKIASNSVGDVLPSKLNEKRKSLICHCCNTGFTKAMNLELHLKAHTLENPWVCNNCQESFPKQDALKSHRQISHAGEEKHFICHECRKRFKTARRLNQHLIMHTAMKLFKCNICSKGFNQKVKFRIHQRVHTGEKPYFCTFCNKRFKSSNWFKNHGRTCKLKLVESRTGGNLKIRPGTTIVDLEESSEPHENKSIDPQAHVEFKMAAISEEIQNKTTNPNFFDKSTICNYCKTGFLELEDLKVHIESCHRGENPWICNHCQEKFENQVKLKYHHRISHTGGKHWICHKCQKRIQSASNLYRHLMIHTGKYPFKCNHCGKGFSQKASLRIHERVHTGEKPYMCTVCNQRFRYSMGFRKHGLTCMPELVKSHTGQNAKIRPGAILIDLEKQVDKESSEPHHSKIIESQGGNNMAAIGDVQNKKSTNPFHKSTICIYCKTGFFEAKTLKMHIKSSHAGENPWTCNLCQRKFQNQVKLQSHHRISHTGEKHWVCHKCKKRFNYSGGLDKHLLIHTGEEPFKCNICKKTFNQITTLRTHSRVHICGFCHQGFKCGEEFKIHVQKCLPKTHESSESSIGEEENENNEKVRLNYLIDENSARVIQVTKSVPELTEKIKELQSDVNIEGQIVGKPQSDVLALEQLSEESSHAKHKSSVCNYCKTGFVEPNALETHSKIHSPGNLWSCNSDQCQESFAQESRLESHRRNFHARQNNYICYKCKKRFKLNCTLIKHLDVHTGVKPYKCNVCYKCFAWKLNFEVHTRIHTGEKPFKCNICGKGFTRKQNLVVHQMSHTGDRPFKCNICGKGFTKKQNLVVHQMSHTGDRPFECNICNKRFARKQHLLVHDISHAAQKPFKCNMCDKSYTQENNLSLHAKSHTMVRRFKRNIRIRIKRVNGRYSVETQQQTSISQNAKAHFRCTICNREFSHKQRFQFHMKSHIGRKQTQLTFHRSDASVGESTPSTKDATLKPLEFDERFENKMAINSDIGIDLEPRMEEGSLKSLRSNINETYTEIKMIEEEKAKVQHPKANQNSANPIHRPNTCNYCQTGFIEPKALKMHIESSHAGENPWICNHCPEKFQKQVKLQYHHRTSHTGEKSWICQKCKKRFQDRVDLNRHLLIHTGEKPFKCDICKKGFNLISTLRVHSRVHTEEKPFICGFCHQRFTYRSQFKKHVQKCLPKTHESSESSFGEEENVENEEVRLSELIEEESVSEIQVTKIVHEISIDGSENLAPKISADISTQKPCGSSSLSSPAITKTQNDQDQVDKIEITEKSSEPEMLKQPTGIDTTTCAKLSEENRRQEWTSFLKVFNVKIARKF